MSGRLAAWILAAVLLGTGGAKLLDQAAFGNALISVDLLPLLAARVLVLVLPWLEVVTAIALLRPTWRRAGSVLACGLSLGFVFYSVAGALLQRPATCGCLGSSRLVVGWTQHAIIAAAMVLAAILALRGSSLPAAGPLSPPV